MFLSSSIQLLFFNKVCLLVSSFAINIYSWRGSILAFRSHRFLSPIVLEDPVLSLWPYLLLCSVGLWFLQNLSVSGANSLVPHSLLTCLSRAWASYYWGHSSSLRLRDTPWALCVVGEVDGCICFEELNPPPRTPTWQKCPFCCFLFCRWYTLHSFWLYCQ